MSNSLGVGASNTRTSASHQDETAHVAFKLPIDLTSNDLSTITAADGPTATMLISTNSDGGVRGEGEIRQKMSKLLKGKEEEWAAVAHKKGPLQLLDLPVDVLKEIVKEVTHTNDLTALALTHSALHNLAIPHIYSRFDIVWPDVTSTSDTRTGVDALTYGLATLVMGRDIFSPMPTHTTIATQSSRSLACTNCGHLNHVPSDESRWRQQRILGNDYSQFTRKFSLGNGPAEWVQEYMITKESGKMLGTLVALAVARMVNLETFIWDMPTGVLRDVWLALSSLQYKCPPGECKLERVLVRWHDNSFDQPSAALSSNATPTSAAHNPAGSTVTPIGILLPPDADASASSAIQSDFNNFPSRVEVPTLSVLPPLRSLSVLDVDELTYLDEMSVLIERSKDRLQELRVGISRKAHTRDFVLAWDGPHLQQVDHNAKWPGVPSKIGENRLGGVLGILVGRIFDIRKKTKLAVRTEPGSSSDSSQATSVAANNSTTESPANGPILSTSIQETNGHQQISGGHIQSLSHNVSDGGMQGTLYSSLPQPQLAPLPASSAPKMSHELFDNEPNNTELQVSSNIISPGIEISQLDLSQTTSTVTNAHRPPKGPISATGKTSTNESTTKQRAFLDGKLRLRVLELERVPLSIAVLQKAFDWPCLTSLTILDCAYHESLWRMLRRQFQPEIVPNMLIGGSSAKSTSNSQMIYHLHLKKIHTDVATPALISFLKETLAPNTLEVLFLQDRRKATASSVTIDAIYRGPLRRHRRSLRKLLIDSSDKLPKSPSSDNESTRWRTWMLNHEVLAYVTSGNMPNLRELSIAIEYKDWHFFLRRLPQVPTLRSLNIPFIADHVTPSYDPRELAMQVVDMIFLRPEIELCYLGISNKCFEILENRPQEEQHVSFDAHDNGANGELGDSEVTSEEDEEEDEDDEGDGSDEDADEDEDEAEDGTATEAVEADGVHYDPSDAGDSDTESLDGSVDDRSKISLRLREILFYDDKVSIFKARHMKL